MPQSIHEFSQEEVMAHLDGELSAAQSLAVAEHLEQCLECQQLASDFRGVASRLGEWEVGFSESAAPTLNVREKKKVFLLRHKWAMAAAAAWVVFPMVMIIKFQQRGAEMARPSPTVAHAFVAQDKVTHFDQALNVLPTGPLIVRTAQLALVSKEFEPTRASVERIVKSHQGYISQLEMNTANNSSRSLSATLRVPASQLDNAIVELKRLGHVNSESQTGEEVTERHVDLEARLSNLRTTEERLQQLLRDRTGKLSDVLEVEQAVDKTRGEIDTAVAEQKALANQVEYATVQLSVSEEYEARLDSGDGSVITRLRNAGVEGYGNAVDNVIRLLVFLFRVAPTVLVLLVLCVPAVWLWRRWRRGRVVNAG